MQWQYPPLLPGRLRRRYKRFLAEIELEQGEVITAHCPNTGPMTGVCQVGAPVWVSQSTNPKRKLAYTWELIQVNDTIPTWVGVNTGLPNRVVAHLLQQRLLPGLEQFEQLQMEVSYGQERSRVDFLLSGQSIPDTYIEVKNTTWADGYLARFPDTVTTRGQKHLRELVRLLPTARVIMLYFINRGDCTHFAPGDSADPLYGQLLRQAMAAGLEIYPCRFEIQPQGIRYCGLAKLALGEPA